MASLALEWVVPGVPVLVSRAPQWVGRVPQLVGRVLEWVERVPVLVEQVPELGPSLPLGEVGSPRVDQNCVQPNSCSFHQWQFVSR